MPTSEILQSADQGGEGREPTLDVQTVRTGIQRSFLHAMGAEETTRSAKLKTAVKQSEAGYNILLELGKVQEAEASAQEVVQLVRDQELSSEPLYGVDDLHRQFVSGTPLPDGGVDRRFYKHALRLGSTEERLSDSDETERKIAWKLKHNAVNIERREAQKAADTGGLEAAATKFEELLAHWERDKDLSMQSSALYEIGFIAEQLAQLAARSGDQAQARANYERAQKTHERSSAVAQLAGQPVKALASLQQSYEVARKGKLLHPTALIERMEVILTLLRGEKAGPHVNEAERWEVNTLWHRAKAAKDGRDPREYAFLEEVLRHPFVITHRQEADVKAWVEGEAEPRLQELRL